MSEPSHIDRRRFLEVASLSALAIAAGCSDSPAGPGRVLVPLPHSPGGHLSITPRAPTLTVEKGLKPLGLASPRDGMRFVPSTYSPSRPVPLLVLLHGAGGSSANWFGSYDDRAEKIGCAVLAIDSRRQEWDLLGSGSYGSDLAFLEQALNDTFDRVAIDHTRMAIAGFSVGASYSLAVGLTNGDFFRNVLAYTPLELMPVDEHGSPRVFVSHGRIDAVNIEQASRTFVGQMRAAGYDVEFVEFDGGHEVPQRISDRAFEWLAESWNR